MGLGAVLSDDPWVGRGGEPNWVLVGPMGQFWLSPLRYYGRVALDQALNRRKVSKIASLFKLLGTYC